MWKLRTFHYFRIFSAYYFGRQQSYKNRTKCEFINFRLNEPWGQSQKSNRRIRGNRKKICRSDELKKWGKRAETVWYANHLFFFCWMLLPGPGISRFNSWKNMKSFPMSKVNFQIPLEMRVSKNIFSKKRSLFWPLVLKHKWVNKGDECHVYPMCDISFPKPLLYFTTLQNYFTAHVHLDYLSFCELLVF